MTGPDVPDRDMPNYSWPGHRDAPMIGDTSLAALLAGTELLPGSPPELRPLAEALAELRAQPANGELAGEAQTLAAFRNQFGAPSLAHRPPTRTPRPRRRHVPVNAVAAAATVLSLGGIATAAYAGALPATVQRLAHDVIGAPAPDTRPSTGPSPIGPASTGDPRYGLCTAWAHAKAHGTAKQRAVAFGKVAAAASGAANVAAYCATAAPPRTSPSQTPQPSPAPHVTGRPSALPTPHSTGQPSGLPTPHGTNAPTVHPTPHSTGKPSGVPTSHGTDAPTIRPTPYSSGQPSGLPTPQQRSLRVIGRPM